MYKKRHIIVMILMIVFSSEVIFAQEVQKLDIVPKVKIRDGDLKNSMITITKTGAPFKVIDPSSGETDVELDLGFSYMFVYAKLGYASKSIIVDTHVPDGREKQKFAVQIAEIELEKLSGKLEDNYVQLIGEVVYNQSKKDFDFGKGGRVKTEKTEKTEKAEVVKKEKITTPTNAVNPNKNSVNKQDNNKPEPSDTKAIRDRIKVEKVIQEDSKKITIITITVNGQNYIYKKEELSWATFYYKDGQSITESTYDTDTK